MPGASSADRTSKEYKQTKAVELYLKHMTLKQISKKLEEDEDIKVDFTTVSKYIKEARAEWKQARIEDMDEIYERELAELDDMESKTSVLFERFMTRLEEDDPFLASKEAAEWIKARLKIKEQRQKLLGLNSPVKMQHSGTVSINLTVADCGEDGGFGEEDSEPEDD